MVAVVRRLREVRAGADIGGERCAEILPCPLRRQVRAAGPAWEAFPEVNRVLLGLLVERMARAAGGLLPRAQSRSYFRVRPRRWSQLSARRRRRGWHP